MPQSASARMPSLPGAGGAVDGLSDGRSLTTVITRVAIASAVYTVSSSAFLAALVAATPACLFHLGPVEVALFNAATVIYFVSIMLPVSLALSWIFRYNQESPYQQHQVDLDIAPSDALQLTLAALVSLPGARLRQVDETLGRVICTTHGSRFACPQEILATVESKSGHGCSLTITSRPRVSAFDYLLFGYTLSVDGNRNKRNIDSILAFLREAGSTLTTAG